MSEKNVEKKMSEKMSKKMLEKNVRNIALLAMQQPSKHLQIWRVNVLFTLVELDFEIVNPGGACREKCWKKCRKKCWKKCWKKNVGKNVGKKMCMISAEIVEYIIVRVNLVDEWK